MSRNKGETFMTMARVLSRLGTCERKQVGAIFIRDGRAISWGYNGAPPGMPHCHENDHGWADVVPPTFIDPTDHGHWIRDQMAGLGCMNATHAEANALAYAARQGISTDESELYVTVSPCKNCARLLIAAGVVAVYFIEEYRLEDGALLLERAGIPCRKFHALV